MSALAIAVRLPHLDWGLPAIQEEALPMKKALEMWGWNQGHLQLDPHTAGWPSLSFYLHLTWQHLQYLVGRIGGLYHDRYDYLVENSVDRRALLLWARMLGVIATAGAVFLAGLWGSRSSRSLTGGLLSGGALALSPLLVKHAQRVTPDILMIFFSALAVAALLSFHQRGRVRDAVWAGVAIGWGAACKYTPVLFLVSLYLVYVQRRRREGIDPRRALLGDRRLGAALAAFAAAFALASPYTFSDLAVLQRDVGYQALHMSQGHFGQEGASPFGLFFYLDEVLGPGMGWPALILALGGMAWAAWRRGGVWLALVWCTLPFLLGISLLGTRFERYMLPLLMPLSLGLAAWPVLLGELPILWRRTALAGLVVATLAPAAAGSVAYLHRAGETDTLSEARQWMMETLLPRDPALAMESYTPQIPTDHAEVLRQQPFFARLSPQQQRRLMDRPVFRADPIPMNAVRVELTEYYYDLRHFLPYDYIVTSSSVRGRYEAHPERFPRQMRFYGDLERYARLEREFRPSSGHPGPRLRFYAFDAEGKSRLLAERGELPPDAYLRFQDRLHAPQFYPFVENVALRAEEAKMWEVAARYLDILLHARGGGGLSRTQWLEVLRRSAHAHLQAHQWQSCLERCQAFFDNGGRDERVRRYQRQARQGLDEPGIQEERGKGDGSTKSERMGRTER